MSTVTKQSQQNNSLKNSGNTVTCKKCKSTQVVANKRGYSFAIMFKVFFSLVAIGIVFIIIALPVSNVVGYNEILFDILMVPIAIGGIGIFFSLPIALLCGFIGRSDIVNGCMNCGKKWKAGKR